MTCQIFTKKDGHTLAYEQYNADRPCGVIYLHGLLSSRKSKKGQFLQSFAESNNLAYLGFDFTSHGDSWGEPTDWRIGRCLEDAMEIIPALTKGPQIIVGSSMGGWIGLLLAEKLPDKVAGFLGLAAGADFMQYVWDHMLNEQHKQALKKGHVFGPSEATQGYCFSYPMFEDARQYYILGRKIAYQGPVILMNGDEDKLVPLDTPFKIKDNLESDNVQIWINKGSAHTLSTPTDLQRIARAVRALLEQK